MSQQPQQQQSRPTAGNAITAHAAAPGGGPFALPGPGVSMIPSVPLPLPPSALPTNLNQVKSICAFLWVLLWIFVALIFGIQAALAYPLLWVPLALFVRFYSKSHLQQWFPLEIPLKYFAYCFVFGAILAIIFSLIVSIVIGIMFADQLKNFSEVTQGVEEKCDVDVPGALWVVLFLQAFAVAGTVEEAVKRLWVNFGAKLIPTAYLVGQQNRTLPLSAPPGHPNHLEDSREVIRKSCLALGFLAATVGLGFATVENVLYAYAYMPGNVWFNVVLRTLSGAPAHSMYTFMVGCGLAHKVILGQPVSVVFILGPSVFMHGLYNFFQFVIGALATFCMLQIGSGGATAIILGWVVLMTGLTFWTSRYRWKKLMSDVDDWEFTASPALLASLGPAAGPGGYNPHQQMQQQHQPQQQRQQQQQQIGYDQPRAQPSVPSHAAGYDGHPPSEQHSLMGRSEPRPPHSGGSGGAGRSAPSIV